MSSVINSFRQLSKRRSGGSFLVSSFSIFSSPAPGSSSVSGRHIFCNPNPFAVRILSCRSFPPFCVLQEILCKPNLEGHYFPSAFKIPHLSPSPGLFSSPALGFSPPNLNLYLALLSAIFPNFFLVLSWLVDSIFVDCSTFQSAVTDKGKPFERMGRKTSDLSNGSWVAHVTSGLFLAHSFATKNGLLFTVHLTDRGGQP